MANLSSSWPAVVVASAILPTTATRSSVLDLQRSCSRPNIFGSGTVSSMASLTTSSTCFGWYCRISWTHSEYPLWREEERGGERGGRGRGGERGREGREGREGRVGEGGGETKHRYDQTKITGFAIYI